LLINDTKPLGTDPHLESDLLERELENGVIVEQDPLVREDAVVTMLGGLVTAEEQVLAREANLDPKK
jgi:hypothetical protein